MTAFIRERVANAKNDILSGLTVALALVPEAVAFAFVAKVDPLVGLYAAFMIGLITAIFGGRPGMISGATGALAVVMVSLVKEGNEMGAAGDQMGLYYLFATVILMGIIQMLAGVFKMGKFVRLIPHPVMMGFVNGLAIVIFISQLGMFKELVDGEKVWMTGTALWSMIGLVGLTMAMMFGLPKISKKIPDALVAIIVVSAIVILGDLDVATVGSFIKESGGKGLEGGLPQFQFDIFNKVPMTWETLKFIGPYALILAAIGLIESLMTLNLIDELTGTRGNTNRECLAQGGANIVTGLFGGMGGCAMIGQSIINIKGGGRTRLSGIVAALALLMFILFASGLIERVPIAALVGVMFMVVIGTFAWSSFRARKHINPDGSKVYEIWGPLFFGSIQAFNSKFDVANDPDVVEIDFIESKVTDHSALEALFALVEKYEAAGKKVILKHLSEDCKTLMIKASPKLASVIKQDVDDPRYFVMANALK